MSWRTSPQRAVTGEVLSWILLGGALLIFLGLLLGCAWTTQAMQPRLRQQAEERRRLNAEWQAVRTACQQHGECPRCASPLSHEDWHYTTVLMADPPEDDDPDDDDPDDDD